ncbi:MAG: hypothetical protein ACYTG1_00190 [Planctomycetota bacterium]|jgi:hypothetical protein
MRTFPILGVGALATAACLGSVAVGADVSIDRLAPESTILLLSVDDASRFGERMKRTSLWELWQTDEMQALWREPLEEMHEGLDELVQELDIERDDLSAPKGAVGLAMFPVRDQATGASGPGIMAVADFGEDADRMQNVIEAAIARGEDEGDLETEQEDVLGRDCWTVTLIDDAPAFPEDEEPADPMNPLAGMPDADELFESMKTFHLLREGSAFLLSTDMPALRSALEAADADEGAGLDGREEYQAVRRRLGDVDGHTVVLTRGLMDLLAGSQDMGMMMMMMQPLIPAVFGDIQGLGAGVRFDGPDAMVEEPFFVYMPNGKGGIPALMDTAADRAPLPPFVGPDTLNYVSLNFETQNVPGFIDGVVKAMPMLQMQFGDQFPEFMAQVEQLCAALGTRMHMATTVSRPLQADSIRQLFALEATNVEALESQLAGLVPMMGLEPRDFLGQRIFSAPEGMASMGQEPPSIGIGGGHLFMGPTPAVEQALRTVSRADAASLRDDPAFGRGTAVLADEPASMWGFSRMVDAMEAQLKVIEIAEAQMMAELREQFPEAAEEFEDDEEDGGMLDNMDFDLLRRHIGPTAWEMRPTEDGFLGRYYMLSAGADAE